jgi:hypothetical protein
MKTFISEGKEITVPDYTVVSVEPMLLQITEGDHAGIVFRISNIRMDDADEGLMWYDLDITDAAGNNTGLPVDNIKETVDNYILMMLYEQIERSKNENPTTE